MTTNPDADRRRRPIEPVTDCSATATAAAVSAFQAGEVRAVVRLMTCFDRMMKAVASRYLWRSQDVEDAVQDAWILFTRRAHTIESPVAIAGWLSVTTARAALSIARRQARLVPTDPAEATHPAHDPEQSFVDDDAKVVREAVARLGTREQELIHLLFGTELSYAEISDRIDRPIGAIGPTRQRLMSKLRRDRSIRQLARTSVA